MLDSIFSKKSPDHPLGLAGLKTDGEKVKARFKNIGKEVPVPPPEVQQVTFPEK